MQGFESESTPKSRREALDLAYPICIRLKDKDEQQRLDPNLFPLLDFLIVNYQTNEDDRVKNISRWAQDFGRSFSEFVLLLAERVDMLDDTPQAYVKDPTAPLNEAKIRAAVPEIVEKQYAKFSAPDREIGCDMVQRSS